MMMNNTDKIWNSFLIKQIGFVIILSILFPIKFIGQDYIDIAKFNYSNTPINKFDSSEIETRVQEYGLDVNLPIVLSEKYIFITGVTLESSSTRITDESNEITSVYTTLLKAGVNIKHNKKWTGTYMLLPKLSSDLKDLSSDDFQLGALAILKYHKKENLKYRFGLYYNSELFGPYFVFLIGLYYKSKNNKLEIDASLPVWADVNYRLSPWFKVGSNFSALTRTFNINEPQYTENGEYLVKITNEVLLYGQFEIKKNLIIQTKIGYSLGRRYALYDVKDKVGFGVLLFRVDDDREQLNSNFEDGLIFRVRLMYRLFTP